MSSFKKTRGVSSKLNTIQSFMIRRVSKDNYSQVMDFIIRLRKELFPMLSQEDVPKDLVCFEEYYHNQDDAALFAAFLLNGYVVGTIGVLPYDGRFNQLQQFYGNTSMAEIVKCYVDFNYRRLGIGTRLYKTALDFSRSAGYEDLYLHTHPFLPGAIPFWKAKGFRSRIVEDDPIWNTIHMDKKLV